MKKAPDGSTTVIIVNWNGKHLLAETLYALQLQTYQRFNTVVVDNGSSDGSVDYIRRHFPGVEIVPLGWNSGFARANNIALRDTRSEFAALLNNDAVPSRTWIEQLVKALESNPNAGFAASKMLYFDNPGFIDRVGDAYTNAGVGKLRGRREPAFSYTVPEWIFGACAGAALYRTKAIKEVGLFDEEFFLINEDVDLSFRLQSRGYRCLYVPEAVVYHKASSSIVHDSKTSVYYGHRNLEWVYLKNLPIELIIKTLPLHLLYVVLAFTFFMLKGHGRTYLKGKQDALKGLHTVLKKRRKIQAERLVDTRYLASLMTPEDFFSRKRMRQQTL
ncbi:MAG: glycosyltransferase family 2 protein [Desulfobacteraceae bacterium]|jgi:GT2 family glycosyltransferase|nr:glycosyltransferase family 2 protein [Desulfobacteraceae bacterium]